MAERSKKVLKKYSEFLRKAEALLGRKIDATTGGSSDNHKKGALDIGKNGNNLSDKEYEKLGKLALDMGYRLGDEGNHLHIDDNYYQGKNKKSLIFDENWKAVPESNKFYKYAKNKGILQNYLENNPSKKPEKSFKEAFEQARKEGKTEFQWEGKNAGLKSTRKEGESKEEWLSNLGKKIKREPSQEQLQSTEELSFLKEKPEEKLYTPIDKNMSTEDDVDTFESYEIPEEPEQDFLEMLKPYAEQKTDDMIRMEKAKKFEDMIRQLANRPIEELPQEDMTHRNMFKHGGIKGKKYGNGLNGEVMQDEDYKEEETVNEIVDEDPAVKKIQQLEEEERLKNEQERKILEEDFIDPSRVGIAGAKSASKENLTPLERLYSDYKRLQNTSEEELASDRQFDLVNQIGANIARYMPESTKINPTNFARQGQLDRSRQLRDIARQANLINVGKTDASKDPNSSESKMIRQYANKVLQPYGETVESLFGSKDVPGNLVRSGLSDFIKNQKKDTKMTKKEEIDYKAKVEDEYERRKEKRKAIKKAESELPEINNYLAQIDEAIKLTKESDDSVVSRTGPIADLFPTFTELGQGLQQAYRQVSFGNFIKKAQNLGRAFDSEVERELYELTQAGMGYDEKQNLKNLERARELILKQKKIWEKELGEDKTLPKGAKEWLEKNPDDPRASTIRKRLGL